jgi:hypothetical protein
MTNNFETGDSVGQKPVEQQPPPLINSLSPADWQQAHGPVASGGEMPSGQLSFSADIYKKDLDGDVASLGADTRALKGDQKDSSQYIQDLNKLDQDETKLESEVVSLYAHAPTFADYQKPLQAEHSALEGIAKDLDHMGLNLEGQETTGFYPLSKAKSGFDAPPINNIDPGSAATDNHVPLPLRAVGP